MMDLFFTKKGQQKMKENFITSIVSTWSNSISEYFKLLQEYPIKLVSLILDLAIVIFIVVKMFQIAKGSRALQLIKGCRLPAERKAMYNTLLPGAISRQVDP